MIDDALMRPGRFDRKIYIPPPDFVSRIEIFKIYTPGIQLTSFQLETLSMRAEYLTGADIRQICTKVILETVRSGCQITYEALLDAVGHARPSVSSQMLKEYEFFNHKFGRR